MDSELAHLLFSELCHSPADEQERKLAAVAEEDSEVARYVRQLLDLDCEGRETWVLPFVSKLGSGESLEMTGSLLGFEVEEPVGWGGSGIVYRARQLQPSRTVALKVLRPDLISAPMLRRFELESEVLGYLSHPSIARVHAAGTLPTPTGQERPWFAMEWVSGQHIDDCVKDLALSERLALFTRVCRAVHHAHQRGVVHRDLKPSNILVTAEGHPKVMDFGIARVLDAKLAGSRQTEVGQVLGTLAYMSPEQVDADPASIDTRTDVYSLGVLLYELLCGSPPLDLQGLTLARAARVITEEEPRPLGSVREDCRGDLEVIAHKAMAKDKEDRYGTAAELAADIDRHLAHYPIEARPSSKLYRLRKFVRRRRALVTTGILTCLALLGGSVGTSIGFLRASANAKEALARTRELEQAVAFQEKSLSDIDLPQFGLDLRARLFEQAQKTWHWKADQTDPAERVSALRQLLSGVDFTGLALDSLHAHVLAPARAEIASSFGSQPTLEARLLGHLGTIFRETGLLREAEAAHREAFELLVEVHGRQHLDSLRALRDLALTLRQQGSLEEAAQSQREVLRGRQQLLGNADPWTWRAMDALGLTLFELGQEQAALALHEQAFAGLEESLGLMADPSIIALSNLALAVQARGDLARAFALKQRVWELCCELWGDSDPRSLTAANNLATSMAATGRFEASLQLQEDTLHKLQLVKGALHPMTLTALNNLGMRLYEMGETERAVQVLGHLYDSRREIDGAEHSTTLAVMNNLATVYLSEGNAHKALELQEEALQVRLATQGAEHRSTLILLTNMAKTLSQLGEFDACRQVLEDALVSMPEVLGPDDPATLTAKASLGSILVRQGESEAGLALKREVFEARTRTLGSAHPHTLTSLNNLASILGQLGQREAARGLVQSALPHIHRASTTLPIHRVLLERAIGLGLVEKTPP